MSEGNASPVEQEPTCEACGKPCGEDRLHVDGSGFMACEAAFTDDGSGDCPMSLSKEEWRLNPYIVNQANREVWAQGYAAGKRAVPAPSDQEKLVGELVEALEDGSQSVDQLLPFLEHRSDCPAFFEHDDCSCGLSRILERAIEFEGAAADLLTRARQIGEAGK